MICLLLLPCYLPLHPLELLHLQIFGLVLLRPSDRVADFGTEIRDGLGGAHKRWCIPPILTMLFIHSERLFDLASAPLQHHEYWRVRASLDVYGWCSKGIGLVECGLVSHGDGIEYIKDWIVNLPISSFILFVFFPLVAIVLSASHALAASILALLAFEA